MKHRARLLLAVVSGLLLLFPLAPAHAGHAARTSWTREDPSFPFRWDACHPIPYRVNLAGTPHRNLKVVKEAVAQIARVTGFDFVYAGGTAAVPFAGGSGALQQVPDDGLYIAWASARQVPGLQGNIVGLGGPGVSYQRSGDSWRVQSGGVVIDKAAHLTDARVTGPSMLSLMLHELGHAMGLGHSSSRANVMYEGLGPWSRPRLGPGDKAGLRRLGAAAGCF